MISVGIPFRDSRATLLAAVRSVFAQTYVDWELILVDDGSSDESLAVARSVDDARVTVISDGRHLGLCRRLNQITSVARGKFLARMDADDIMHPSRLAEQVRCFSEDPSLDIVGTAAYTISQLGSPLGILGESPLSLAPRDVLERGLLIHPSVMGRTGWFVENPYDTSFARAEDHELWCRALGASSFAKLSAPLLYYRANTRPAISYLRYYLHDKSHRMRLIRRYGPKWIGLGCTLSLLLGSCLKCGLYCAATALGLQAKLVKARSRTLTQSERKAALEGLAVVASTPVPGPDERWKSRAER